MIKHLPAEYSNNFIKLRNSLISATGKAIGDYNMIEDGDTVLVCKGAEEAKEQIIKFRGEK